MKNLFEYSDILHSPIEAFTCATENVHLPVEAHWHYFMEVIYLQEGSVLVTCNDACKRVEAGSVMFFPPQAVHAIYADGGKRFRYFCIKFNMNRIRLTGSYLPDLNLAFRRVGADPFYAERPAGGGPWRFFRGCGAGIPGEAVRL